MKVLVVYSKIKTHCEFLHIKLNLFRQRYLKSIFQNLCIVTLNNEKVRKYFMVEI